VTLGESLSRDLVDRFGSGGDLGEARVRSMRLLEDGVLMVEYVDAAGVGRRAAIQVRVVGDVEV
jgi:hypothetical protein